MSVTIKAVRTTSVSKRLGWMLASAAIACSAAGFGAAQAAPIARRVFDYWQLGDYPSAEDIEASQKGLATSPMGVRRRKEDILLTPTEGVVGGIKNR